MWSLKEYPRLCKKSFSVSSISQTNLLRVYKQMNINVTKNVYAAQMFLLYKCLKGQSESHQELSLFLNCGLAALPLCSCSGAAAASLQPQQNSAKKAAAKFLRVVPPYKPRPSLCELLSSATILPLQLPYPRPKISPPQLEIACDLGDLAILFGVLTAV